MPVEAILDHPKMINCKSVFYGCVMRILHHYWRTECEELPQENRELESIGHFTEHLWRQHGEDIMSVVRDVLPTLDRYFDVRVNQRQHLRDLSKTAAGIRMLKASRESEDVVKRRMGQTGPLAPKRNPRRPDSVAPVRILPKGNRPVRTD